MKDRALRILPLLACLALPEASPGMEVSIGAAASSLSPTEPFYDSAFLTPGTCLGAVVMVDAPGPLSFSVGLEDFSKDAPEGWDGSVDAFLVTLFPTAGYELLDGFELYAGPGAVYLSGDYSGTDRYGRFVEADGASVGFGFSAGGEVSISGPFSGRLEYRRTFMDISTGSAVVDGTEQAVYPAEETDLGYSQFGFALVVSILGGEDSLLGGL
jgi:opacity protein-like surface antigen